MSLVPCSTSTLDHIVWWTVNALELVTDIRFHIIMLYDID